MTEKHAARPFVDEYVLPGGRRVFVLAEGRLINLAAAEGHPASVMDMSFANQAWSVEYLHKSAGGLTAQVHPVPSDVDREVARLKLGAMRITIDMLTPEQKAYLGSWNEGT